MYSLKWQNYLIWPSVAITSLAIIFSIFQVGWLWSFAILAGVTALFLFFKDMKIAYALVILSVAVGQLARFSLTSFGSGIILSDILVVVFVFGWIILKLAKREAIKIDLVGKAMLIFLGIALISLILGTRVLLPAQVLVSAMYLVRLVVYFALYFIGLDIFAKSGKVMLNILWLTILIVTILGFLQYTLVPNFEFMQVFGWDPHQGRLLSTFFDPNFVGGFLAFGIAVALGVASFSKVQRYYLYPLIAIQLVALVLTFSRSAYIALFVIILLYGLIYSRRIIFIGLIALAILFAIFPKSTERLVSLAKFDTTARYRLNSWSQTWQVIKNHPITGIGYNALAYEKMRQDIIVDVQPGHSATGSDSSLLTIWATTGIFGLISYLVFYIIMIVTSFKIYMDKDAENWRRGLGLGLGIGLIGLFINSQIINSLFYPAFLIFIFTFASILYAGQKIKEKDAKNFDNFGYSSRSN